MVPSKTAYSLAVGSAILAISNPNSELSDILEKSDCGYLIPPGEPSMIADRILDLASQPILLMKKKRNARLLAESHFARDICIANFRKVLKSVE